jgi:hypothetical protein
MLATSTVATGAIGHAGARTQIHVYNTEQLYDAVNDVNNNTGVEVVLEPAVYMLSALDPMSIPRPNGGRLELQPDMTLTGHVNHADWAVIDASALPASSYSMSGAVRTGLGSNRIEWLTVRNAVNGQSGIDTGLGSFAPADVRLAYLIVAGNPRGIDIRNNASHATRSLTVDVAHNEIAFNQISFAQGIRVVNNASAGSQIQVSMAGNSIHHNGTGLLATSLNCSNAAVFIESSSDHFDANNVGVLLFGANSNSATPANGNYLSFDTTGSTVRNNVGAIVTGDVGGLVAIGGLSTQAGNASNNVLDVRVRSTPFSGNQTSDISSWGARTNAASPAGTNNHVTITLGGVSRQAVTAAPIASAPADPGGTNTVTIVR